MSSKVHVKNFRSVHWLNQDVMSSTSKNYSNLLFRNLYLKLWLQRNQLSGVKVYKKYVNSKVKDKNMLKWGPAVIKNSFHGIYVSSWHQMTNKRIKSFFFNNKSYVI